MNSLSPTRPSPRRRLSSPVKQPVRRRQQLSPTKENTSNNNFRNMVAKYSPKRPTSQTVISGYPNPHVAIPKPYKRRYAQTSTEQSKGGMSLLTKVGYGVLSLGAIATAIYAYKTSGGTFSKDLFKLGGLGGGSTPSIPDIPSLADNQNVGKFSKYIKYLIGGAVAGGAVAVGGYNTYRNRTMSTNQNYTRTGDLREQRAVIEDNTMGGGVENGTVRDEVRDEVRDDVGAGEQVLSDENTEARMINTPNHEETKTEQRHEPSNGRLEQNRRINNLFREANLLLDSQLGRPISEKYANTRFP